jgi:hypothetical protein
MTADDTGGTNCSEKLKLKKKKEPCNDKRDLTNWLPDAAIYMAKHPEIQKIRELNATSSTTAKLTGAFRFYNLVRDGAEFDVKDKMLLRLGPTIKLGEDWYEYSTAGNILYGFYGIEAGYDAETLKKGAGYAQVMDVLRWAFAADKAQPFPGLGGGDWYFDTNEDSHAIDLGIWMHHTYYETLEKFPDAWGLAREADPGDCIPNPGGSYPPDAFDQ